MGPKSLVWRSRSRCNQVAVPLLVVSGVNSRVSEPISGILGSEIMTSMQRRTTVEIASFNGDCVENKAAQASLLGDDQ